jgi:hypothetical protein
MPSCRETSALVHSKGIHRGARRQSGLRRGAITNSLLGEVQNKQVIGVQRRREASERAERVDEGDEGLPPRRK